MRCPHCGERVSASAEYCPMCDTRLKTPKNKVLIDNKYETASEQYSCKKEEHADGDHSINLHGNETKAEQYSCKKPEHSYECKQVSFGKMIKEAKENSDSQANREKGKGYSRFVNRMADVNTQNDFGKVLLTFMVTLMGHVFGLAFGIAILVLYGKSIGFNENSKLPEYETRMHNKKIMQTLIKFVWRLLQILFICSIIFVIVAMIAGIIETLGFNM